MLNLEELTFEQIRNDIYPEVISDAEAATYPSDTVYHVIVQPVRIAFIIDFGFEDGSVLRRPVTQRDINRWRIIEGTLIDCSDCGNPIPVREWTRISRCGKAYAYPSMTREWNGLMLRPGNVFAQSVDIKGLPIIMIPYAEMILLTGDHDSWGMRDILRQCLSMSLDPITKRPLILEEMQWHRFSDSRNPIRRRIQKQFGADE